MINWVFDKPEEFLNMTRCPTTVVKDNVLLSGRFPVPNLVWYWTEADRWASGRDVKASVYSVDRRPNHYIYNIGTWTDPTEILNIRKLSQRLKKRFRAMAI